MPLARRASQGQRNGKGTNRHEFRAAGEINEWLAAIGSRLRNGGAGGGAGFLNVGHLGERNGAHLELQAGLPQRRRDPLDLVGGPWGMQQNQRGRLKREGGQDVLHRLLADELDEAEGLGHGRGKQMSESRCEMTDDKMDGGEGAEAVPLGLYGVVEGGGDGNQYRGLADGVARTSLLGAKPTTPVGSAWGSSTRSCGASKT